MCIIYTCKQKCEDRYGCKLTFDPFRKKIRQTFLKVKVLKMCGVLFFFLFIVFSVISLGDDQYMLVNSSGKLFCRIHSSQVLTIHSSQYILHRFLECLSFSQYLLI